jgi:hypothetical protein
MAVNPPRTPPPPRLPHPGVAGAPAGPAGSQLTNTNTSPRPSTSLGSPTWASVVRGEARREKPACPEPQPAVITAADFSALYQRCMASSLKARVIISHAAGCQVLTVSCSIPVPAVTDTAAGRRHRRRRRRGRATTAACEEPALPSSLPVAAAGGDPPLPALSTPPHTSPTPPSPEFLTPPAKRTRRRRNEVELLRDHVDDNEMLLSPLSAPATPHTATLHASTPLTTPTTTAVSSAPTLPASWEDLPASLSWTRLRLRADASRTRLCRPRCRNLHSTWHHHQHMLQWKHVQYRFPQFLHLRQLPRRWLRCFLIRCHRHHRRGRPIKKDGIYA